MVMCPVLCPFMRARTRSGVVNRQVAYVQSVASCYKIDHNKHYCSHTVSKSKSLAVWMRQRRPKPVHRLPSPS